MTVDLQLLLNQWKTRIARYQTPEFSHLVTGVEANFIEPYVARINYVGYELNVLVSTVETKAWWDILAVYMDIELVRQFRMIKPGDVVFDLGASHGIYSTIFAKMSGPTGRVYAFEPFALNADFIRFNAALNEVNVDVVEVALSNRKGTAEVRLDTQCIADSMEGRCVPIQLDELDNYAHLKPDFIKIDIEGSEIDALESAAKLLAHRPQVQLEVHYDYFGKFGRRIEELFEILPYEDYHTYIFHPGKPIEKYYPGYEITNYCSLYLLNQEPVERIYCNDDAVANNPGANCLA
jgi:FkbM family methyltransferase